MLPQLLGIDHLVGDMNNARVTDDLLGLPGHWLDIAIELNHISSGRAPLHWLCSSLDSHITVCVYIFLV